MRKFICSLAIAAGMLGFIAPHASADGMGPCSGWFSNVRPSMPLAKIQRHTQLEIQCASHLWPVDVGTAMYVANRESHYYPWALNPSGCAGVFQHQLRYWSGRVNAWISHKWYSKWRWQRGISAFDMRANVIVTIRMAHQSGWGPWGG